MNAKPEIYLDIPLQQPAGLDDGSPQNRLRLERAEINKGGLGFQANIMEDERIVASAGLRAAEAVLLMVLLNHVSGQDLCWGLRDYAQQRWGRIARTVLMGWGIEETFDFGRIVFAMIDDDFMQKQPSDSIEDFRDVFDFAEAFDEGYTISFDS